MPGRAGCKDCAPAGRHKNPTDHSPGILCRRKCPVDQVMLFTGLKGGGARVVDVYCRCGGPGRLRNQILEIKCKRLERFASEILDTRRNGIYLLCLEIVLTEEGKIK